MENKGVQKRKNRVSGDNAFEVEHRKSLPLSFSTPVGHQSMKKHEAEELHTKSCDPGRREPRLKLMSEKEGEIQFPVIYLSMRRSSSPGKNHPGGGDKCKGEACRGRIPQHKRDLTSRATLPERRSRRGGR